MEASKILDHLVCRQVDARTERKIQKILLLLLVGEFYGLNTFNSLLNSYDIQSNDYQKLWNKLSPQYLIGLMNNWLWDLFREEFEKRLECIACL